MMFDAQRRKPFLGVAAWFWFAAVPVVSGFGCGGKEDATSSTGGTGGGAVCVPGIQIACACKNGTNGAQACKADGSGFGACMCSPEAGGSANGGMSGVAGGAGSTTAGSTAGGGDAGAGDAGDAGAAGAGDAGAGGGPDLPITDARDFPEPAILEEGVPLNAAALFAAATDSPTSSLCVFEPQLSSGSAPGAMFPSNWTRPRFRFAAANYDLFEIRLHSAAERNDLVVYTKRSTWYLPKDIWHGLGSSPGLGAAAAGSAVSVTIRALNTSAPLTAASVSGSFNIAPAVASGSILFTTRTSVMPITPDWNKLLGFSIGDEGVQAVLRLSQISWSGQFAEDGAVLRGYYDSPKLAGFSDGSVRWINHPALTPGGQSLVFNDDWPYPLTLADVTAGSVGAVPAYLGQGALGMLRMPWLGSPTLSAAHWVAKDRTLVSSYGTTFKSGKARTISWQSLPAYRASGATEDDYVKWHSLAWFDLEASFAVDIASLGYGPPSDARSAAVDAAKGSSWGLLATGDKNVSNVSPSFNPAGDTLAYVATDYSPNGDPDKLATKADIRLVPYNDRKGGTSQPLNGASDPNALEYEPTFSPDGKLIAFTRAAAGGPDGPYRNRSGEVTVIPASGGTATRLVANDPNACAADPTPLTLVNGSPAWGPSPVHHGGRSYYFLVFTSARKYGDEFATQFQLDGFDLENSVRASTQVYLTTIVVDDKTGSIESYPAVYIWNQNRGASSGAPATFAAITPLWGTTALAPQTIPPVP